MNNMGMNNMGMNNMGMNNMGMNNMNMNMMNMNPQMGGNNMSNSMGSLSLSNPMMNQMSLNPQMMGMNPMMMNSMGPMGMNAMMMPNMMPMMNMQKQPLTEEQKKQLRMQGYLLGKKMAEEKKKNQAPKQAPVVQQGPATGEISIKFNKGGSVTTIKMDAASMVAEAINEYFEKTKTKAGTFKFNGQQLDPMDATSLADAGFNNGSEVTVT
jgi:hypothetical protein